MYEEEIHFGKVLLK